MANEAYQYQSPFAANGLGSLDQYAGSKPFSFAPSTNGYKPPFHNFNAADPSTFTNIPQYQSMGNAVNLPTHLLGAANKESSSPGIMSKLLGKDGKLIPGLEALGALGSGILGLKQYGLDKAAFNFSRGLAKTDLSNRANIANAAISDRARARAVQSGASRSDLADIVKNQTADRRVRGTV